MLSRHLLGDTEGSHEKPLNTLSPDRNSDPGLFGHEAIIITTHHRAVTSCHFSFQPVQTVHLTLHR
jgi:hypothetical protein